MSVPIAKSMPEKRNARLLLELACWHSERQRLLREGNESALADLDGRRLSVFVTYEGPIDALHECNLVIGHYDGTVATGSIAHHDVDALCNVRGVTRVSLAAPVYLHIDRSMPEIKANLLRSNAPPYTGSGGNPAYTGKGVLIGVIDDAIYERHLSFTHPNPNARPQDRKTRIVAIWDQIAQPIAGQTPPPPPFVGGTYWTESQINSVLAAGPAGVSVIKVSSAVDHGTHVTGIAAGNGSLRDNQFAPYTFVGVAPEADIAFCNAAQLTSNTARIVDAMNFIFKLAEDRGQPCVINMSFGTHEGARDGSSDLERAIDRVLTGADGEPRPGRAVVVAAGNEADMRRHSRKIMSPGGQLVFRMFVAETTYPNGLTTMPRPAGNPIIGYDYIVIWYAGEASIEIRVTPPGGPPEPPMFVGTGGVQVTPRVGIVVADAPDPANGKNYISIRLFGPVALGEWKLELRETAGVETPVDIWIDRNGDFYINPRFVDADDIVANTVTCPATAQHVIAVGAYISEPSLSGGERYGEIAGSSSRGLDSAYGASDDQVRPHLTAPGRRIVSTNNSSNIDWKKVEELVKLRYDGWTLRYHLMMSGTSQAAPHVTGTVALMFQKNPNLTSTQIREILTATATKNQIPILGFPNRVWGYGKLDANAAVAAVPAP